MALQVEGFAIVSEDGMLADSSGVMPPALLIDADQAFLLDALNRAALLVHGRNSHEGQPQSPQRRRLIATRSVRTIEPVPDTTNARYWNPAGLPFDEAATLAGVSEGTAAILGGTDIYGLFLPRYDVFHLSRMPGLRLPGGRPVFRGIPQQSPEDILSAHGLISEPQRLLDSATGATVTTWRRESEG